MSTENNRRPADGTAAQMAGGPSTTIPDELVMLRMLTTFSTLGYRCPLCGAKPGEPEQDSRGIWHITVIHEDACPMIAGGAS